MGTNTLATKSDGQIISSSDINQYKTAFGADMVPRNTSGAATDEGGSLGTASLKWLKAFIASGYWDAGDIKAHHTYDGATPVGQGWFPCDGTIINETNYDAIHGAGSWAAYVGSSPLDGKYAPDLEDKYLVGSNVTNDNGSVSIPSVGNSGSTVNLQHSHTVNSHTHTGPSHTHRWTVFDINGFSGGTFASNGSTAVPYNANTDTSTSLTNVALVGGTNAKFGVDGYVENSGTGSTGAASPSTNNALITTQDIRPESIRVIYYIRII